MRSGIFYDPAASIDDEIAECEASDAPVMPPARNDTGNARDFIDRHGEDLRYVPPWDLWLVWNQCRWNEDRDGAVPRMAMRHSCELLAEAAAIQDESARKAAAQHALGLGNAGKIKAMIELARYDKRVILDHAKVNAHPMLVGTAEGVIDLTTGEHRPARKDEYVTRRLGVRFDPAATCPRWRRFISEVFNGDESLCRWIQKAAGYTLTGSITEQCFLFLYGHGSNGKSTFLDAIEWILGDYSRRAGEGLLKVSPSGRDPAHEIADLNGTRLSLASELEAGMKLNENLIKAITGDGTLKGRRLYEEAFEFPSTAKLWIAGNHKPAIHGTDNGIWRRVRLVPFAVQFTGQAKDPTLARCFREDEAAGILNWMLEGVGLWQSEGLGECAAIVDAVAEYREESDTLGQFIEETTEHADHWVRLTHSQLFRAYVDWCDEQGMKFKQPSRRLAAMLRERGWVAARTKNGPAWTGRTLKVTEGERTA